VIQRSLWSDPPAAPAIPVPIFRRIVRTKLYVRPGEHPLQQWLDVTDFILFRADGEVTDHEDTAAYVLSRHEGVRIWYAIWRAHSPESFQRELLFRIEAGPAHRSADAMTWKAFTKANHVTTLSAITDYRCLGGL
jgi:hypothetical protein